jgi:hypothetical protein
MLEKQGGKCAVCGIDKPGGKHKSGTFMIDHNHETGKVRGLLCNYCNRLIGAIESDVGRAKAATVYLELHSTTAP